MCFVAPRMCAFWCAAIAMPLSSHLMWHGKFVQCLHGSQKNLQLVYCDKKLVIRQAPPSEKLTIGQGKSACATTTTGIFLHHGTCTTAQQLRAFCAPEVLSFFAAFVAGFTAFFFAFVESFFPSQVI